MRHVTLGVTIMMVTLIVGTIEGSYLPLAL